MRARVLDPHSRLTPCCVVHVHGHLPRALPVLYVCVRVCVRMCACVRR
jgi:hypothetical protein